MSCRSLGGTSLVFGATGTMVVNPLVMKNVSYTFAELGMPGLVFQHLVRDRRAREDQVY